MLPPRFRDRFFEKREPDVEKFFTDSGSIEPIFCMFGNWFKNTLNNPKLFHAIPGDRRIGWFREIHPAGTLKGPS
jgi:hypothetical protein